MADDRFQLRIITPERVFYEGEASMIELTTTEGEIGVYKNHVPLTYIIAPGILRIMETGETKEAALHSGFIEILQEKITILAEAIEWPNEIDVNRAQEAKVRAERRLNDKAGDINLLRAETALQRALARIQVAKK
ncbi:ATP synthase F1 subunit epsilon [bacterium 1XD42-8]|jgi:F-type H+-transporting ATPase subunit epsilon|nr:ATP synthase F1 subunit epsilon [Lachnospiraceae bacterium]RKJ52156.1 ATP synthase F1 subunit epsilon [bacterium 1XD42-8]